MARCYTIKARIHLAQHDRSGRINALERAVEFDPDDPIVRHQYGVALSIDRRPDAAIDQFTVIVDAEKMRDPPGLQLLMALKTRMINLKRLGRDQEFQSDLALAQSILTKYPHFASEAHQFKEFFDNTDDAD